MRHEVGVTESRSTFCQMYTCKDSVIGTLSGTTHTVATSRNSKLKSPLSSREMQYWVRVEDRLLYLIVLAVAPWPQAREEPKLCLPNTIRVEARPPPGFA